jgi:hypothetical protein
MSMTNRREPANARTASRTATTSPCTTDHRMAVNPCPLTTAPPYERRSACPDRPRSALRLTIAFVQLRASLPQAADARLARVRASAWAGCSQQEEAGRGDLAAPFCPRSLADRMSRSQREAVPVDGSLSGMAFQCPRCSSIADDPVDVAEGYCPRCRAFTGKRAHPAIRELLMREGGPVRAVWPIDHMRWADEDAAHSGHD